MADTPQRNVRIPDDEWRALQQAAANEGTTVSALIRAAVRKHTKGEPTMTSDHWLRIETSSALTRTVCRCGWESEWLPSAIEAVDAGTDHTGHAQREAR